MTSITERFYTPKKAAEYVGVSRSTIYLWVKQGRLKQRKLGGRLFFEKVELDNLLQWK